MNASKEAPIRRALSHIEWGQDFDGIRAKLEKARLILGCGYDHYSDHDLAFRAKAAEHMMQAEEGLAEMIGRLNQVEGSLASMRLLLRQPETSFSPPTEFGSSEGEAWRDPD